MKDSKKTHKPVSITRYSASSFWLDRDFDTNFKREGGGVDLAKLAAAQRAIGNFVNIVTGQQIPVIFQSSDSSYTDGERVVIGTKLDGKHFDPAVGLALHEGSHIALTDFDLFKRADGYSPNGLGNTVFGDIVKQHTTPDNVMDLRMLDNQDYALIKDLLNWIEDRRIDFHIYTTAPGYRNYYEAMYNQYFNDKVIDKALLAGEKCDELRNDYMFHIINFTNANRKLDALTELRSIWNLIDIKKISRLKSTTDALLLACQVYKIIDKATAAAEQAKKDAETADILNKANTGSDDSTEDEEGEGNDSGGSADGDETDSNGDSDINPNALSYKELEKLQNAIDKQREFINGNSKKAGRITKNQAATVNALRESGTEVRTISADPASGILDNLETIVIKKLTPGIICSLPHLFESYSNEFITGKRNYQAESYPSRDIARNDNAVTKGIILGKQLGRKLQVRDSERSLKTTRLQTGKIDKRLISQLGYDNANVFHRIVTDRFKNYFIHISIDASGSMSGRKFNNAITSAVAVAQAASMTTGIRVQISLRGTHHLNTGKEKAITMYVYDSAQDKMSKIKSLFKYLDTYGCTPEGLSFKSIEKDIKKDAKGDECIFINYSDGEPSGVSGTSNRYDGVKYTKKVVNEFKAMGINVISYFIYEGSIYESTRLQFREMYGPDAQFIDPIDMNQVSKTVNEKFLEMLD